MASAFPLLVSYATGLGVPFILVGFFTFRASTFISAHVHTMRYASVAFGFLLILLGVLVFTQTINRIASFEVLESLVQ